MATTYDSAVTISARREKNTGFARRLFNRFVEARQTEANHRILAYLRSLDRGSLERLGYTPEQISLIVGGEKRAA